MIYKSRQRPTLPHSHPCSTISDERLNFCVRNGNRCDPLSIATGKIFISVNLLPFVPLSIFSQAFSDIVQKICHGISKFIFSQRRLLKKPDIIDHLLDNTYHDMMIFKPYLRSSFLWNNPILHAKLHPDTKHFLRNNKTSETNSI
jgi:hypothetical protein